MLCAVGSARLHSETLAPRSALPPLLLTLAERPPEALQYLGTSFGLTQQLFSFWHRSQYQPVYVRQTASELTGESSPCKDDHNEHAGCWLISRL